MRTLLVVVAILFLPIVARAEDSASPYVPKLDSEPVPNQPYDRYFTTDKFGRLITFYLSKPPKGAPADAKLPLVVYVHGSGSGSNFMKRDERVVGSNGHSPILPVVRGRARLLIIEKPGVKFLDAPARPGGTDGASEEFVREHTLDRWSEAVSAAMKAARALPEVDPTRTLVVGHSEGGLVACKVAADNPFITNVACLAGGGPTQLFDLVELTREGKFAAPISPDPNVRVQYFYDEYAKVLADPESTTKMFMGHPYRRWSCFLATSPMEQLAKTDARIYLAQGSLDSSVHPMSFHALRAVLVTKGKDLTADFVVDADHSFNVLDQDGKPARSQWQDVMTRVVHWYLPGTQPSSAPATRPAP